MSRLPPANRIKTHRIYTVWEAADALGRHRQTVIRWIKTGGLVAETDRRPWLIAGSNLKAYLGHRRRKAKSKLALHQLYCLGCRLPQEPAGKFADYVQQTPSSGMLTALCPACSSVINKVVRRADLEAIKAKIEVTIQQANPRIVSRTDAPLNATFTDMAKTNVKTHLK